MLQHLFLRSWRYLQRLTFLFPNFHIIYDESHCGIWTHNRFRPNEDIKRFWFCKRAPQKSKIWSNELFFFTNILKNMMNQRLIHDFPMVLGLLKLINSLDRNCGPHKVGFQSEKGKPLCYCRALLSLQMRISTIEQGRLDVGKNRKCRHGDSKRQRSSHF